MLQSFLLSTKSGRDEERNTEERESGRDREEKTGHEMERTLYRIVSQEVWMLSPCWENGAII